MTDHGHLFDTHPNLKVFAPFLDDLNRGERTRRRTHIGQLCGNRQLKEIVSAFLCEGEASERLLEGFNAPLGTLAARAAAAAALGLISRREYRELETIRKIRNQFAHDHRTRFSDQGIVDRCRNLACCSAR